MRGRAFAVRETGKIREIQAFGLSMSTWIASGSLPVTMSESFTVSRTARSLARRAIHTRCSGSADPG